jgi:hypothetical protein
MVAPPFPGFDLEFAGEKSEERHGRFRGNRRYGPYLSFLEFGGKVA